MAHLNDMILKERKKGEKIAQMALLNNLLHRYIKYIDEH